MKKFCVIGPKVGRVSSENDRRWFDDEEGAVDHARVLLAGRPPGSTPAFVVEVKRVVEVKPHPLVDRTPKRSDFEELD